MQISQNYKTSVISMKGFSLVSQSLPDHTHLPTLEILPRDMHLVANPGAAKIVKGLGYKNVTVLEHGESTTVANGRLTITAVAGTRLTLWTLAYEP